MWQSVILPYITDVKLKLNTEHVMWHSFCQSEIFCQNTRNGWENICKHLRYETENSLGSQWLPYMMKFIIMNSFYVYVALKIQIVNVFTI